MNTTQLIGFVAFGAATLACAQRARSEPKYWWALTTANAVLFIEILANTRHQVHDLANAFLVERGMYEFRSRWQMVLTAVVLVLLLAAMYLAHSRIRSRPAAAASAGVCFGVGVFAAEIISLHAVDVFLYRTVGSLSVISLVWLATSAWICTSAFVSTQSETQSRR